MPLLDVVDVSFGRGLPRVVFSSTELDDSLSEVLLPEPDPLELPLDEEESEVEPELDSSVLVD